MVDGLMMWVTRICFVVSDYLYGWDRGVRGSRGSASRGSASRRSASRRSGSRRTRERERTPLDLH
jgi:hypothetical protein